MTRVLCFVMALLVFGASQPSAPHTSVTVTRRVHYTAADQDLQRYAYVPFPVPPGTTRITVAYRYDRAEGANAVDLGLYEPGPLERGMAALRGWSGGAREQIEVATDTATPGYWPGPLLSGEWHVVLGLYKVAPAGVDVELTVTTERSARPTAEGLPQQRRSTARKDAAWYAGVLHTHTLHSDGALTTAQLLTKAADERLDFIAITDHNNTVHQRDLAGPRPVLVIPGEEVTTTVGHFNIWGLHGDRAGIDFRVGAEGPVSDLMNAAARAGGLVSLNHPVSDCLACSWTAPVPASAEAIEIANGTPEERRQAMLLWDVQLRAGRRMTAVEGRDWHRGNARLGQPAVRVWAKGLSETAILEGIQAGRVVVVSDATLPVPRLEVRSKTTIATIGDALTIRSGEVIEVRCDVPLQYGRGRVVVLWNGEAVASGALEGTPVVWSKHPAASGYVRAHILDERGTLLAVTNPIYIVVR